MIQSPRISNVVFYVSNIDVTEQFYRDTIGLQVQRMPEDDNGNPWLIATVPDCLDLIFFAGEPKPGNSPILVFDLPQGGIDDVVARFVESGVTMVTPVSHSPGGWSADYQDPDGYVWSVYQSEDIPR